MDLAVIDKFLEEVKNKESKQVNICLHDTPDPDAIGSGVGMAMALLELGYKSEIYYSGDISHPQNKTLINVLNIVLKRTKNPINGDYPIICVDGTPSNSCAERADLVIDHHKNPTDAEFQVIDPSAGSCSTLVWQIIKHLGIEIKADYISTYTALLLGIRTDTNDLISENMSVSDFEAYQELLEHVDKESLQKIMNYPFPRYLYDKRILLHKEGNFYEANGVFVGGVGYISGEQRDAIAVLAEEYARMESVNTAVIFAITDSNTLRVSVRSSNVSLDVGQMCRDLFDGNGGGTSYKGGAGIPLGFYSALGPEEKENFWQLTCKHMFRKVLKESWNEKEIKE